MFTSSALLSILLISLGAVSVPIDAASFRCYEGSFTTFSAYSLNPANLTSLRNSPCLNASKETYAVSFGFQDKMDEEYMRTVVTELLRLGKNVLGLNWEEEASGGILGDYAGYLDAYANVVIVGNQYGQAICEANIPLDCIVGFSLGAHLAGAIGTRMKQCGRLLPRIIGLDPAGPVYDELPIIGLNSNDASYTMCVDTNPGGLGTIFGRCHTNVWVNCGNRVQTACAGAGGGIGPTTPENSCSHNYSWRVTVDASQNPCSYVARLAPTCAGWRAGQGRNVTLCLGFIVDTTLQGNFYLTTNAVPPYGRGLAGSNP